MIRKANKTDINSILEIVLDARKLISKLGFKQWTKESNYPNYDTFLNDIKNDELYVYVINDQVEAVMALVKEHNYDYDNIEGKWLSNAKYYTIHRLAVKEVTRGKGLAYSLIDYAKNICLKDKVNLRIDTHLKNIPMQNLINKSGFKYTGIIKLKDELIEPERKAYELVLV